MKTPWLELGLVAVLMMMCAGCSSALLPSPTTQQRAQSLHALGLSAAAQEQFVQRALASTVYLEQWDRSSLRATSPGKWTLTLKGGHGTGVILSEDGYILTAAHCVAATRPVFVGYPNQQGPAMTPARRVWVGSASDPSKDLAILKVEASGLTPFAWAADNDISTNAPVAAAGGAVRGASSRISVVAGRITHVQLCRLERDGYSTRLIGVDTPIGRGDSGGPVLTPDGRLIAINRAMRWAIFSWRVEVLRPDPAWISRLIELDRTAHSAPATSTAPAGRPTS